MKQNFTVRHGALDGVKAFVSVAEHRSFRKAAAELGVTPSAISQAVGAFEARVRRRAVHPHDALGDGAPTELLLVIPVAPLDASRSRSRRDAPGAGSESSHRDWRYEKWDPASANVRRRSALAPIGRRARDLPR